MSINFCWLGWHRPLWNHRHLHLDGAVPGCLYSTQCSCGRKWIVNSMWPWLGSKVPCEDEAMAQTEIIMFTRINDKLVRKVREWLGEDGLKFFRGVKEKYGRIDALWMDGILPHPVHFREGMRVRNFMRDTGLCKGWDAHDYDNRWVAVVERAIQ